MLKNNFRFISTITIIFLGFIFTLFIHFHFESDKIDLSTIKKSSRIVSLSPSVTELLYSLGLGDRIVGVTRYCIYPEDAKSKTKVGGYNDYNIEAIIREKADLVVLPSEREDSSIYFKRVNLPVLLHDDRTLDAFLESVTRFGQIFGKEKEAKDLCNQFIYRINDSLEANLSVLLIISSSEGDGGEVFAVGRDGFYSELIKMAGGKNAYNGKLPFVRLSREALSFIDPDIIIIANHEDKDNNIETSELWKDKLELRAVKNKKVYMISGVGITVPGPRSLNLLDQLTSIIKENG